jgi:hypothetical protein
VEDAAARAGPGASLVTPRHRDLAVYGRVHVRVHFRGLPVRPLACRGVPMSVALLLTADELRQVVEEVPVRK